MYQSAIFIMQSVMFNELIYYEFISSLTCAVHSISGDAVSAAQNWEPGTTNLTLEKIRLSNNICVLDKLF